MAGSIMALHTSAYGARDTKGYMFDKPALPMGYEDVRLNNIQGQIDALEAMENDFCGRFGFNNPAEMITKIKEILSEAGQDMEVLQRFESTNLRRYFNDFKNANANQFTGQDIRITTTTDKGTDELNKLFSGSGGTPTLHWEMEPDSNKKFATLKWDHNAIKGVINKLGGKTYKRKSTNLQLLINYLQHEGANLFTVEVGSQRQSLQSFIWHSKESPFQYSQEDIRDIQKNDPALYNNLVQRINSFVYDTLCAGASSELRRAVDTIMGQQLKSKAGIGFFMGGADHWINNTVGNFGELQAAILFQYISNKSGNTSGAQEISRIIGNVMEGGQKIPSDLALFEAFGIQVKNYSGDMTRQGGTRTITVNLHPSQLPSLGAGDFSAYIANSYFNSSVEPYSEGEINDFIKSHSAEILNLELDPTAMNQNTVSFYLVGGHLIPGSDLLRAGFTSVQEEEAIQVNTTFTHPDPVNDDEGFNTPEDKKRDWHRPFREYWQGPPGGPFVPTDAASVERINGRVSFHTSFTFSAFFKANYSLFPS